jgi:hypothetical protein
VPVEQGLGGTRSLSPTSCLKPLIRVCVFSHQSVGVIRRQTAHCGRSLADACERFYVVRGPGARSPVHAPGIPAVDHDHESVNPRTVRSKCPLLEWSLRPRTRTAHPASRVGVPAGKPPADAQGGGGAPGRRDHSRSPGPEQATGGIEAAVSGAHRQVPLERGLEHRGTAGDLSPPLSARLYRASQRKSAMRRKLPYSVLTLYWTERKVVEARCTVGRSRTSSLGRLRLRWSKRSARFSALSVPDPPPPKLCARSVIPGRVPHRRCALR